MITGNAPEYIRHTFKVKSELKSYTVFELVEVVGNRNLLTELLRIERFNGKSNTSNVNNYLRLRTRSNWNKSDLITGLRPTQKECLFYGDWLKSDKSETIKKTLLLFKFSKDSNTLFIDVYRGFYPNHKGILQNIIDTY